MDLKVASGLVYQDAKLARNEIVINIDAHSLVLEERAGLRYELTLQVPPFLNASTWEDVPTMVAVEEPVVDVGGVSLGKGAFFTIDKILISYLEAVVPEYGQAKILPCENLIKPFRYITKVKNNGVELSTATSEVLYALRAGIAERLVPEWGEKFLSKYVGANRSFLTSSPIYKVLPDQDLYLYFLTNMLPSPTKLNLRVFRWYADGTEDAAPETLMTQDVQAMMVYCVPASPKIVAGNFSKVIARYMVWLTNEADEVVSKMVTYTVDHMYYEATRVILFRNSLGGYDSLGLTGKVSERLDVTRELTERIKPFEATADFSEIETNLVKGERELTVSTGWLSDAERKWLDELALSEDVYLVTDREYLPIRLVDDGYVDLDSKERLIGRTFVFKYNNIESSYADLPVIASVAERPTGWRAYAYGACELDAFGKRTGKAYVTHIEKYYLDNDEAVKPVAVKPNTPGTEGYLIPQLSAGCATTPFLSELYTVTGNYKKTGCGAGTLGAPATISIAAGRWGSEDSLALANAKAEAEAVALDTQAYADANGSCVVPNVNGLAAKFWNYTGGVYNIGPTFDFNATPKYVADFANANVNGLSATYPTAVSAEVSNDRLLIEWNGYLKAPVSGVVNLIANVDDGVRIYIDDILVMDKWLYDGGFSLDKMAAVSMVDNSFVKIKIQFYSFGGFAGNTLSWSYAGQAKVVVPDNMLFNG